MIGKLLHVGIEDYGWFNTTGGMTHYFVEDMTRLLLASLFVGCAVLVWIAMRRKQETTE